MPRLCISVVGAFALSLALIIAVQSVPTVSAGGDTDWWGPFTQLRSEIMQFIPDPLEAQMLSQVSVAQQLLPDRPCASFSSLRMLDDQVARLFRQGIVNQSAAEMVHVYVSDIVPSPAILASDCCPDSLPPL